MVCENDIRTKEWEDRVLILVLMEYGLRGILWLLTASQAGRLNPCFNGIWSASIRPLAFIVSLLLRLNPCFNGIWSARVKSVKICM